MPAPEKYKRSTWWKDASGQRQFLFVGIDIQNEVPFVDLWEVGKNNSKYVELELFEKLIQEKSLVHFSLEQPYKLYLHE